MWSSHTAWCCIVVVAIAALIGCTGTEQPPAPNAPQTQAGQASAAAYQTALDKPVTVSAAQSPDGAQLTVQYAAIALCEAAGVPYQWEKSRQLAGDVCSQFVPPLNVSGISGKQALTDLLTPLGVRYEIDGQGLYVTR
ncbi:MAG: hypothetical protein IT365_27690 [Candidatus Hydrogenedentes bacterium]|nr:hypothetical protein [Candidatus Hydrogenedentota bacterium]